MIGIGAALLIATLYIVIEFAGNYWIEGYCYHKADKIPKEQRSNKMEPTPEQKQSGFIYVTLYYKTIWECEDNFNFPTFILGYLNQRFP